ncbi:MAG: capsule biosynthesis protein [Acidobacteria bacterium]|nr:capsule biosynthesis protein [Acidobacteriota bacterium]
MHILLCDEALPACAVSNIDSIQPEELVKFGPARRLCETCFSPSHELFRSFGLAMHRYSEFISTEEYQKARDLASHLPITDIGEYHLNGMAVGKHALAGALRFCVRGNLEGVPLGEAVLRRYFNASLLTAFATHRLMNDISFRCVCAIDGLYVPTGMIGEVARQQKVRVVNWNVAYRKHSFVFSHHESFHHTLLFEPTTYWENMRWTPEMEAEILGYLKSRWYGTGDWIAYVDNPEDDVSAIAAKFGIDFSKPCIGMLTNIVWEGQVLYRGTAFRNMLEWALETIRYFSDRPDLQLILRVHPAEVRGIHRSRQPIIDEIKRAFPTLPKNVFIIPPDSTISTYATMLKCDAVIIYGTQTGVELASMGIPVIVAGEAWIRNKGVALDASSRGEYFRLLDRLPLKERLSEAVTERARKYAYHFFFRRMGIPLVFMVPTSGLPPFRLELSGIDDLLPGRSVGLDVICNGILNGDEFIYPAELHPEILNSA